MPRVAAGNKLSPTRVRRALTDGLAVSGIRAAVETEKVPGLRLYRVLVTSREFDRLSVTERQELVWRIMEQNFTPDEQLQVSMILALTPGEMNG